jgi:hypothetical protein
MTEQSQQKKARRRHDSTERCVYTLVDPVLGPYFSVMITRNGTCFQKNFFECRHDEAASAKKLAIAWRDKVIAEKPATTLADFCAILRSTNTTGIAGVSRRSREYRQADGTIVEHASWVASVPDVDGRECRKSFSVRRFGEEKAREKAIHAREAALSRLADAVFRPGSQPKPVSTAADLDEMQTKLGERTARRQALLEEREKRKQVRETAALERRQLDLHKDAERLAQPTNASGIPYVSRTEKSPTAGYWRVSMEANGTRYRKTFSDAVHGGRDAALKAAIAWRDVTFVTYKSVRDPTRLIEVNSRNSSGATGVFLIEANEERTRGYWVARSPKQRGKPGQSRRFSIAKYGFKEAFDRAVRARAAFVETALKQTAPTHLVARRLQQHLASVTQA